PETKKLVEIEDLETIKKPKEVTTYVASTRGECYILLPASGEDPDKLNKDLTDKFLGILNQGKIHMSPGHCISFNLKDIEYPQGFVMFKLETSEPKLVQRKLLEDLNDKNLQPKSFIENNLTNKAVCLDYDVLKNFLNYVPVQETETVETVKKKGRPFGSKNKKSIDSIVSDAPLGHAMTAVLTGDDIKNTDNYNFIEQRKE
ncbi:MAG: hypothetical protein NTZ83_04570, partial [Candidatus Pacearchaeota archaeon]|nr:hypothetical protein [Candidatus Pacearchaeota archaeon]